MPDLLLSIQSTILGWVNQLYLVCLVIWHELCSWWRGLGFDQGVESVGSGRFYTSDRSDRLHIGPKIMTDRSGIFKVGPG